MSFGYYEQLRVVDDDDMNYWGFSELSPLDVMNNSRIWIT